MHILRVTILCGLIASSPASAFERFARLQPTRETMLPHLSLSSASEPRTDISTELTRENRKSKSQHDQFEQKSDRASQNSITSICSSCLGSQQDRKTGNRHRFASGDGSAVSAEWIYSRRSGFDPAQAGGRVDR